MEDKQLPYVKFEGQYYWGFALNEEATRVVGLTKDSLTFTRAGEGHATQHVVEFSPGRARVDTTWYGLYVLALDDEGDD